VIFNLFVAAVTHQSRSGIDAFEDGVPLKYRLDGSLFNLSRLRAITKVSRVSVVELQYADDAAYVSHTAPGLQRNLNAISDSYARAGLIINTDKTEILIQQHAADNGDADVPQFFVSGNELKTVPQFTYLGSVLTSECSLTDEILRRIALASAAFGKLSRRVFYNHDLTISTKRSVYQAVCLSVLLYGCESWAPYRHQVKKLESFHTRCLQRILGLHWWDRVPHTDIRRRMGVPTLEETLLQRQLRWTGHVIRQPASRLPRRVLYGELATGHRSVGGQRKRYKDHVKATIKKFNMNPGTLERDAADRSRWRALSCAGAAHFGVEYDSAAAARRERRHNPPADGAFVCPACARRCATLAGLRSHQRSHNRR
jgi:hypothetical protein